MLPAHPPQDDDALFSDETNGRNGHSERIDVPPWKILVVDDDLDIHRVTRLVLAPFVFKDRPIVLIFARSGVEARMVLREHPDIAVAILDVVMETDDSGLLLARFIRDQYPNRKTRIILRTGQPGYAPEIKVMLDYDINDYRAKAELTAERLLTAVATSLRSYQDIENAERAEIESHAARQANIAKTAFLANMSHELRTPLNAVIGNIELLQLTQLSARQVDIANSAAKAAHILLNVIGDVLDLSKIEADRFEIDSHPADLTAFADELYAMFSPQSAKKGLTLSMTTASTMPTRVITDPTRLRQVLMNLIANAIKFTAAGGVHVEIAPVSPETTAQSVGAFVARFTVTDTGIGFNTTTAAQIFEPFIQAEGHETRVHGGSGLGLTIAKRIVELLGGKIGFTSTVGVGSKFWCDVPLMATGAPPTLPGPQTSSSSV